MYCLSQVQISYEVGENLTCVQHSYPWKWERCSEYPFPWAGWASCSFSQHQSIY